MYAVKQNGGIIAHCMNWTDALAVVNNGVNRIIEKIEERATVTIEPEGSKTHV
jgi:hypothetical protein